MSFQKPCNYCPERGKNVYMLEENTVIKHVIVTIHIFTIKSKETKYFSLNFGACSTTIEKTQTLDTSENVPDTDAEFLLQR